MSVSYTPVTPERTAMSKPLYVDGNAFEDVPCPLPECAKPLYVSLSYTLPVLSGSTQVDLNNPAYGITMSWEVVCEGLHVVMLPEDEPQGFSDDDMARLRKLLGVPDPESVRARFRELDGPTEEQL